MQSDMDTDKQHYNYKTKNTKLKVPDSDKPILSLIYTLLHNIKNNNSSKNMIRLVREAGLIFSVPRQFTVLRQASLIMLTTAEEAVNASGGITWLILTPCLSRRIVQRCQMVG